MNGRAEQQRIDQMRREVNAYNRTWPTTMKKIDGDAFVGLQREMRALGMTAPVSGWRSQFYIAALYNESEIRHGVTIVGEPYLRLSICKTSLNYKGEMSDGLSWDDLMRVKRECGYAYTWAVELFPSDVDVVNVANLRHLWLLPQAPSYGWRQRVPAETQA